MKTKHEIEEAMNATHKLARIAGARGDEDAILLATISNTLAWCLDRRIVQRTGQACADLIESCVDHCRNE